MMMKNVNFSQEYQEATKHKESNRSVVWCGDGRGVN